MRTHKEKTKRVVDEHTFRVAASVPRRLLLPYEQTPAVIQLFALVAHVSSVQTKTPRGGGLHQICTTLDVIT
jgi:hypothetical protein